MLELGLKALISYLVGSLNASLLLGAVMGGPDIRTVGSGNPGGTNALRARGKWFAFWVMAIDIGKGYLAAAWIATMSLPGIGDPAVSQDWPTGRPCSNASSDSARTAPACVRSSSPASRPS